MVFHQDKLALQLNPLQLFPVLLLPFQARLRQLHKLLGLPERLWTPTTLMRPYNRPLSRLRQL